LSLPFANWPRSDDYRNWGWTLLAGIAFEQRHVNFVFIDIDFELVSRLFADH